jgi:hypothetical protein
MLLQLHVHTVTLFNKKCVHEKVLVIFPYQGVVVRCHKTHPSKRLAVLVFFQLSHADFDPLCKIKSDWLIY